MDSKTWKSSKQRHGKLGTTIVSIPGTSAPPSATNDTQIDVTGGLYKLSEY